MFAASRIGAPISPIVGMKRGTRRDRYSRVPKRTALTHAMKPGPNRKVQSRPVTSAWPVVVSADASAAEPARSCRRATTVSRATTPIMMTAASTMRDMTNPRARDSLTRLTTGKTATALPMPARALTKSRKHAHTTWVSWPAPTM